MVVNHARRGSRNPGEPVLHDLNPIRCDDQVVPVRIAVRRTEDGSWRGRLVFGAGDAADLPCTAEIFVGPNETDLWDAVRSLGEYHVCDLYRSLLA